MSAAKNTRDRRPFARAARKLREPAPPELLRRFKQEEAAWDRYWGDLPQTTDAERAALDRAMARQILGPPPRSPSPPEPKLPIPQNAPAKTPRPGSADAWIDELCPNGAWRTSTAKRIHDLIEQRIEELNVEIEREAKKQNRKPPPAMRCPGLRAFQTALAKRRRKLSEAERNKAQ